ncbi:uncharacterized protein LACBIDRAFT_330626 [Laccaria bicolor S238N-H82]|uniref:Predicted protein n=1 Tax=Laccaria bicolor (strain S238N-H82 / ATCC MYA-4686) TaxID=486041 RepID=B0DLY1_LACBS|nr:uncharacterized protein LACBIDRAFT_330626 [Laccaria bicolor S238N-H82]EDR04372.1 predicted protein [Laccaria bicolor S238N-H82]|eukprot:XP_001884891.1 predicted protein [Laccaria bicolor S238N-H82]
MRLHMSFEAFGHEKKAKKLQGSEVVQADALDKGGGEKESRRNGAKEMSGNGNVVPELEGPVLDIQNLWWWRRLFTLSDEDKLVRTMNNKSPFPPLFSLIHEYDQTNYLLTYLIHTQRADGDFGAVDLLEPSATLSYFRDLCSPFTDVPQDVIDNFFQDLMHLVRSQGEQAVLHIVCVTVGCAQHLHNTCTTHYTGFWSPSFRIWGASGHYSLAFTGVSVFEGIF